MSTKTPFRRPSPTGSNTTRQTLVESVNALAVAHMPDPNQAKLTEEKVKAQVSKHRDDIVKRLLETKRQLQTEADNGVRKLLRKYEKKLTKELTFSSDSEDDNSSSSNAD